MPKRSCAYTQTICRLYPNWNGILYLLYPSCWMYRCSKASASIQATPLKTQRAASFWGRTSQKAWYSNPATGWLSWWIWLMTPRLGVKGYGSTLNNAKRELANAGSPFSPLLANYRAEPLNPPKTGYGRGKITHSFAIPQPSKDSIFWKFSFLSFAISFFINIFAKWKKWKHKI